MTNCPAYVPVIVELYPAASKPMAQMYLAEVPNESFKASDAESRSRLISLPWSLRFATYAAKVAMTAVLIKNETNREIELSMVL